MAGNFWGEIRILELLKFRGFPPQKKLNQKNLLKYTVIKLSKIKDKEKF